MITNVKMCDCVNQAPTFPVFRDFLHFPECPLSTTEIIYEHPLGDGRVIQYSGPKDYWKKAALRLMRAADYWESKWLNR